MVKPLSALYMSKYMLKLNSPKEDSHWDPNDDLDHQRLQQCQEALLEGMKEVGKSITGPPRAG
jgi:hypothetical protein